VVDHDRVHFITRPTILSDARQRDPGTTGIRQ
jgi:hypothetical protein